MKALSTALVVAFVGSGCATVETHTSYSEDFLRDDTATTTNAESSHLSQSARLDGTSLTLSVQAEDVCTVKVTPVFHKAASHEHVLASGPGNDVFRPRNMFIYGLVSAALGAYALADPAGIASSSMDPSMSPADATASIQATGGVMLGVGALLVTIAAIDTARLSDTSEDLGEVRHDTTSDEQPCHARDVGGAKVSMNVASDSSGWIADAVTDARGHASISLREIPESAFRTSQLSLVAAVGTAHSSVVLTEQETTSLVASLEADTGSRLVRDRETKRAETCEHQVSTLKAFTIDADTGARELERLERNWIQAKTTCGDQWSGSNEEALAAFHGMVEKTTADRVQAGCTEASTAAIGLLDEDVGRDDETAIVEAVQRKCVDVSGGDKLLARIQEHASKHTKARERSALLAGKVEKLNGLLATENALGLRGAIATDKDARAALATAPSAAIDLARHWIEQTKHGHANPEQLCASRAVLKLISLDAKWGELRRIALGDSDAIAGNRAAKAMEKCQ